MVLGLWVYSFILVLPTVLELHGQFGYDQILGKCGYLKRELDEKPDPRSLYFCIGFFNPLMIMLGSYYSIWRKTINSSSFIKLMWFVFLRWKRTLSEVEDGNFQSCPDQETAVQQRHEDHLDSVFAVFLLHHICGTNRPLHPHWCPGSDQSPLFHPVLVPGR